ncbi:hypothetical protein [Kordia sp.]|uniref:hypothetical protein n=1 Tax=Kordia sp. TaxID=1965332 RepID=UPI003B5B2589
MQKTVDFYFNIFKKKGLFKLFTGLEKDLSSQYNKLINNKLSSNINLIEEFYLNVFTGINNESYDISWSIPKAEKLIKDNKISSVDINISHLYSDVNNLEQQKLQHYQNIDVDLFEPIIVSYYEPIKKLIVIDGNHRVYWSNVKGKKNIKAFILSPFSNPEIMNEKNFQLYVFHHNLVNLINLCCNPLDWKFEANKSLNWNTYYGDVKFKNLFFNKLKMIIKKPYLPKAK